MAYYPLGVGAAARCHCPLLLLPRRAPPATAAAPPRRRPLHPPAPAPSARLLGWTADPGPPPRRRPRGRRRRRRRRLPHLRPRRLRGARRRGGGGGPVAVGGRGGVPARRGGAARRVRHHPRAPRPGRPLLPAHPRARRGHGHHAPLQAARRRRGHGDDARAGLRRRGPAPRPAPARRHPAHRHHPRLLPVCLASCRRHIHEFLPPTHRRPGGGTRRGRLGTIYEEDRTKFPSITGSEDENDEDIDWDDRLHFPAGEKEIDISKNLRDIIHLEITLDAFCSSTCKGLCLVCGANLNTSSCSCSKEEPQAKDAGRPGTLRDLLKPMQRR